MTTPTPIVIDIPASLATLIPTLPPAPQWTSAQVTDFIVESMFTVLTAGAVFCAICLIIVGLRKIRDAAKTPHEPRVKSQTFTNWLIHGGVNGVQR
jgi:hypothetical protein